MCNSSCEHIFLRTQTVNVIHLLQFIALKIKCVYADIIYFFTYTLTPIYYINLLEEKE